MKNGFHYSGRAANLSYLNLSYPKFNHKKEAGYILITYACLISFALIIFAAGYLRFQVNQVRQIEREICSVKAFYIAQAGLQKILRGYAQNPPLDDTFDEGAKGEYHGKLLQDPSRIRVTGKCGMKDSSVVVARTLEATVRQEIKPPFTPSALYVHSADNTHFYNLPGTIDGKTSFALQCPDKISTELFNSVPIYLKSGYGDQEKAFLKQPLNPDPKGVDYYQRIEYDVRDCFREMIYYVDTNNTSVQLKQSPFKKVTNPRQCAPDKGYDICYADVSDSARCFIDANAYYGYRKVPGGGDWRSVDSAELTVKELCKLPGGNYYLTNLELSDAATLRGSNDLNNSKPVIIICSGNVVLGANATIKGYGNPPQAKNFSLRCFTRSSIMEINENCQFIGTILAPNCHLILHRNVKITGSVVVDSIEFKGSGSLQAPWFIEFDEASSLWPIEFVRDSDSTSSSTIVRFLTNWQELREN